MNIYELPEEIKILLVFNQIYSFNRPYLEIFQNNPIADIKQGGFNWSVGFGGYSFWDKILRKNIYSMEQVTNVLEIVKKSHPDIYYEAIEHLKHIKPYRKPSKEDLIIEPLF